MGSARALAVTRERRSAHDPGRVLCDLAVMAADGGRCVSDLAALAGQPALFGEVASVSTGRRVLLSIGEDELDRIRQARAQARERAWAAGAAPARTVIDFDATPIDAHSEKERAAGHYKGGFGFNPLLATCGREVLAGDSAPRQRRRQQRRRSPPCARARAGAAARRTRWTGRFSLGLTRPGPATTSRSRAARPGSPFSLGYAIHAPLREAILGLSRERVDSRASTADGQPRDGAWVAELTGRSTSTSWPVGTRLICRRERPHPGAQLSFTDLDGHRFQCFITDQPGADIAALEAVTASTPTSKTASRRSKRPAPGTCRSTASRPTPRGLSSRSLAHDITVWTQQLTLDGEHRIAEPKRLR